MNAPLALLLALNCSFVHADVTMPHVFSDNMILQRDMPVPIWGLAANGEKIVVSIAGQQVETVAKDGKWSIMLAPLAAGGPFELLVKGNNTLTFKNVLAGEVWIAAGQSNMMMGIASATGGQQALNQLDPKSNIRIFTGAGEALSPTPQADVPGRWAFPNAGDSAVSTYFAMKLYDHFEKKVPVGIMTFSIIRPVEAWCSEELIEATPKVRELKGRGYPHDTAKAFNAVIKAVAPYGLRGALYYQGEMNGGRGLQYRTLMPLAIQSWRNAWGKPELPFLFVQLPGFEDHREAKVAKLDMDDKTLASLNANSTHGFIEVREAQLKTWQSVPHTGMAITLDVGDAWNIHPANKEPVAARLLLQARKVAYGENIAASGPVPLSFEFQGGNAVVKFENIGGGLSSSEETVTGFYLAGADRKFHPADARISGDTVIVSSASVAAPAMLHYAWAGFPKASLRNKEGLPATPFRFYDQNRIPMASDEASFNFKNPSFEVAGKPEQIPESWGITKAAVRTPEKSSEGKFSVILEDGLTQNDLASGLGIAWNSDPSSELVMRPGCLAGYSVDIASGAGEGLATGYMRLAQDASAAGYETWGIPMIYTASETFVRRHIALLFNAEKVIPGDKAGILIASGNNKRKIFLDNLSPVKIVRPLLAISDLKPIDFGKVNANTGADSPKRTISNAQAKTLPQLLKDGDPVAAVAPILYGLANVQDDGRGELQVMASPTDHVGAVLIGANAKLFEFVSDNCGVSRQQLKLIGADKQPGLFGGPNAESEPVIVRFVGSKEKGRFEATLRIVTQAGNMGRLSLGLAGEPPVNLFYVDIPVSVQVE